MPKMKTKSAAKKRFKVTATGKIKAAAAGKQHGMIKRKKRFKITATGKIKAAAAGKQHGMIKRSNKFLRDARGTMVLAEPDAKKIVKNYLPNGL